jgi:hypothetical protein
MTSTIAQIGDNKIISDGLGELGVFQIAATDPEALVSRRTK